VENLREILNADLSSWEIGPYHGALPAPFKIRMQLDGEIIVRAELESGFLHRGVESAMKKSTWESIIVYADHIDPEAAVFAEMAICLAAEKLGGIEVPERARSIRLILSELSRIASHLRATVGVARKVGGDTLVHYVMRDRERVLDLFELLAGARFSLNFLRIGGVRLDMTEGFIERVFELCELIRVRLKEYNDLFTFNSTFVQRSTGVAALSPQLIDRLGVSGPNARASGKTADLRKDSPYSGYEKVDFHDMTTPTDEAQSGDCHERFVLRLREISQSVDILKQLCEKVPSGKFLELKTDREFKLKKGESHGSVESSRGLLRCDLQSSGGSQPEKVTFTTPTAAIFSAIPELLRGEQIEDLGLILASLDLSVSEMDR